MTQIKISKNTIKRLLSDVKDIIKNPLTNNGIYYEHDKNDLLKGTAMIIGPKDTPYENGYYLFKFKFPVDYPYNPPKVVYMTNDGKTRFNPNLYRNGKVCVSILNTWSGDQWTGCQTISSVLLTLCTLLNEQPLLNEPGITETNYNIIPYNSIINFKNISFAIYKLLNNELLIAEFEHFYPIMIKQFFLNYDTIIENINNQMKIKDKYDAFVSVYRMETHINYTKLLKNIKSLYKKLNKQLKS